MQTLIEMRHEMNRDKDLKLRAVSVCQTWSLVVGNVAFCISARQQDGLLRRCAKNQHFFSGRGVSRTGHVSSDATALASQEGEEALAPRVSLPNYWVDCE